MKTELIVLLSFLLLPALASAQAGQYCKTNAECSYPYVCQNNACEYHLYECTTNAQCADGYICDDGYCAPKPINLCGSSFVLLPAFGILALYASRS